MIELLIKTVIAYLLGSLIGSLIVGKLKGDIDIRNEGSGNAGGTNALRTRGKAFAAWVMLIDIGKGVLAVAFLPTLSIPFIPAGTMAADWIGAACAIAVVFGHVYPVFFGFRGGKGVATIVGVLAVLSPWALLVALLIWATVLMLTGYVRLSSIIGVASVPVYALVAAGGNIVNPLFVFGAVMALFVLYTHRSNVRRILEGTEYCFEKAMLLKRR